MPGTNTVSFILNCILEIQTKNIISNFGHFSLSIILVCTNLLETSKMTSVFVLYVHQWMDILLSLWKDLTWILNWKPFVLVPEMKWMNWVVHLPPRKYFVKVAGGFTSILSWFKKNKKKQWWEHTSMCQNVNIPTHEYSVVITILLHEYSVVMGWTTVVFQT